MLIKRILFVLTLGVLIFTSLDGRGTRFFTTQTEKAFAYEASSSSFFIHGGGLDSIDGVSSGSVNYSVTAAAGQAISGFASGSTNFFSKAGMIPLIYRTFQPNYTQTHFHWRNDDGSETTATSATGGVQDTTLSSMATNVAKRLRVEISNEGGNNGLTTQQFRIEYGLKVSTCAAATYIDVGAAGGDWDMSNSSNITDGNNTTNISQSVGGVADSNATFLTPNGGLKTTSSTTGSVTVDSSNFIELEYSILPTSLASGNYCFRVTNAGSTTNYTYSTYAESSVSGGAATISLTLNSGGSIAFGSITAGNLRKTATTNLLVTQTNATSFNITAGRQRAVTNATLASNASPFISSNQISDTARGIDVFSSIANCSTAGSHPAQWPSQTGVSSGLGFTLWKDSNSNKDTTCWGSGTTESASGNNYAALQASASASSFVTISSSPPATYYASIGYSLEVPSTQKATIYNGAVIYTVTAVP